MQIVAVTAPLRAIVNMEVARTNTEVRHVISNLTTHIKGHAPVEGLNFFVADLARAARILAARIECAHGLVEHKKARMRRHHTGKRHALLLPARESRGVAIDKIGQTENAQIALGELFARGGVASILYTGAYVIGHRHVGKQGVILEQVTYPAHLGPFIDL